MSGKTRYMLVQYVTVARVPLAALAAVLLTLADPASTLATVVVGLLIVCELTDVMDGLLARRLGQSSRFGARFDPYCDSISRLIIFFGLASRGLCPMWLFLVMALRDVSVAYIRIMYILSGKRASARASGKAKAWVQGLGALTLAALFAHGRPDFPTDYGFWQHWLPTTFVLAGAVVTVWSPLDHFGAAAWSPDEPESSESA